MLASGAQSPETGAITSLLRAKGRPSFRTKHKENVISLLLIAPLFFFVLLTFVGPIVDMLVRSVDNSIVAQTLPRTTTALADWNPDTGAPSEEVFQALAQDIEESQATKSLGAVANRLNYELAGTTSLFRKTARSIGTGVGSPFKQRFIDIDDRWADPALWKLLKRESRVWTSSYFLAAMDLTHAEDGTIALQPPDQRIYLTLFLRTFYMSGIITGICLVLAFPIAFLLSTLPRGRSTLLLIVVLLPLWTSLLVRTTAWIVLLQTHGVINDLLVAIGIVADTNRLQMIHNQFGTVVAMTHILLPFMVLPLYAVMKTIPGSYMRAACSLGAGPAYAFYRVYIPSTRPGIAAGCILVFVLSIGFYITPALVGGRTGTFISNLIAQNMSVTLNWGLAAALSTLLLAAVLAIYSVFNRFVGLTHLKLG
jgi:putative spermidine/putrescine transport system permease protein